MRRHCANGFAYVVNLSSGPSFADDNTVLVIDVRRDTVTDTITVAAAPVSVVVDSLIEHVFVASHDNNTESIIQAANTNGL